MVTKVIYLPGARIQITQTQKHVMPLRILEPLRHKRLLLFKREVRDMSCGEKFLEGPVWKSNVCGRLFYENSNRFSTDGEEFLRYFHRFFGRFEQVC